MVHKENGGVFVKNVLEYLEIMAERTPEKTAIADKDHAYSFFALRSGARRLGQALREAGICDGAVGVFADRGADALVMLLGVLYAGAFYVPLDPDMKEHKLHTIMEDSGMRALVGSESHRSAAGERAFFTLAQLPAQEADLPDRGGDDPAYMIYTSGSTGRPKGVLKSHGAVLSFVEAFAATFGVTGGDIIGNQTPFFFDASAKDIYLALYTGATLEVLPTELFSFPVLLVRYMNERQVSYICWVPTALAIVTQLNTFMEVMPETLRLVLFVGEVFPLKQLRKWIAALPEVRFVNLYGSTELAGICCYYEITGEVGNVLPMGRPLPNCRVFLLDEAGNRVSEPNVLGEVCIASPALALEYYGDPEKTARQFVTMEFETGPARVFRSGDLAQYDENGDLVFSCRADFQIKHMGRRIELGEIEAAADSLPEVVRCCCLYNELRRRITLFCTLDPECDWDGRRVQHELRGRLSDYMVPSKVIVLEALPLNANGKIDRVSLKAML